LVIRPFAAKPQKMSRPKNLPRDENAPSKTQVKKQMIDLQDLGETLSALSKEQLDQLDLPESLRDAFDELSCVGKHEAKRRHMQFIGKLMREVDPEPIRAQLERWEAGTRAHKAIFKAAERWRERLIAEEGALAAYLVAEPSADRAVLSDLIDKARKEAATGQAPAASRKLFREIHQRLMKLPAQ
jgi:ribosome-associated protein